MSIGSIANTGMKATMTDMEVISNNIANANTIGFKKSTANFADVYPSGSAANAQSGLGVTVASISQNFQSGAVESTGNQLDLLINSGAFFILNDPSSGQISYTRAGRFQLDDQGYITNGSQRLQGFPSSNGVITPGGTTTDLQVNNAPMNAKATANVSNALNLNSNSVVPTGTFNVNDPTTFNFRTDSQIYDSLGNPNTLSTFYVKTGNNAWNAVVQVNGATIATGALTFGSNGQLLTATGLSGLSFTATGGAASPQTFSIALTGSTQVASAYTPGNPVVDGYPAGTLTNFNVDSNGVVNLYYSNGQNQAGGQVALAIFSSPEQLQNIGNMSWVQTGTSGAPLVSQSNSTGNILAGSVELSNVDLTDEMVNLISAQQNFQANAQVEQVYNEVMQTVVKI